MRIRHQTFVHLVALLFACDGGNGERHDAGGDSSHDGGAGDDGGGDPGGDAGDEEVGSLEITQPADGATVSGKITVSVAASGLVHCVVFELPGSEIVIDFQPPFETAWSSTAVFDGPYRIVAVPVAPGGPEGAPVEVAVTVDNGNPVPAGWLEVTPAGTSPSPRRGHAMAYDAERDRTVLFGGYAPGSGYSDETWEWNGASWIDVSPPSGSPPPRWDAAMTWDAARGRVVLFGGGDSDGVLGDTWEWDGSRWTEVTPDVSPGWREAASMAFDAARGRVVLFGGEYANGDGLYDDTWTWDGSAWAEEPLDIFGPVARSGHALAWDPERGRVVMYAGYYGETDIPELSDVWEWDGTEWIRVSTDDNEPCWRASHALATYPPGVLVFGGSGSGCGELEDTWILDGADWTLVPTPEGQPNQRVQHAMVHDRARAQLVLFGGLDLQGAGARGDTWIFRR